MLIPNEVAFIIEKLNYHNFEAYIVGGCVRDRLMGIEPKDWDITTNARPIDVKNIFEKTFDTGLKHGTITVAIDTMYIEVTTFRAKEIYLDNRRPASLEFSDSLEEDLKRRDFTVNAMAYHPQKGIIDVFAGQKDLKNKIIKAVGDPNKRFIEDALRMLRAVRFSVVLDFEIEEKTLSSITSNSQLIKNISMERIRDEITKILVSPNPLRFIILRKTGLLKIIMPEIDKCFEITQNHPFHIYDVGMHILHSVQNIENKTYLRWSMLLHDLGKAVTKTTDKKGIDHFHGHAEKSVEIATTILNRLRFDNYSIRTIINLVKYHDIKFEITEKSIRHAIVKIRREYFEDYLKVIIADVMAQNPLKLQESMRNIEEIKAVYNEIIRKEQCLSKTDLKINGKDLISLGFKEGKEIGNILKYLFDEVVDKPEMNEKEILIEMAVKYKVVSS